MFIFHLRLKSHYSYLIINIYGLHLKGVQAWEVDRKGVLFGVIHLNIVYDCMVGYE